MNDTSKERVPPNLGLLVEFCFKKHKIFATFYGRPRVLKLQLYGTNVLRHKLLFPCNHGFFGQKSDNPNKFLIIFFSQQEMLLYNFQMMTKESTKATKLRLY